MPARATAVGGLWPDRRSVAGDPQHELADRHVRVVGRDHLVGGQRAHDLADAHGWHVGARVDLQRQAIFAARGFDAYPGRTVFGAAEQVATPAAVTDATVALDPASDRALALWRGEGARVEYAIRTGPSGP